jgi:hypothetical protein
VLQIADYVTDTLENHGLFHALAHFGCLKSKSAFSG